VKKVLILLLILIAGSVLGAMKFDRNYNFTTYGDFSGGMNLFSSASNVKDNQALFIENFLFYGSKLRARKGISELGSASLGSNPILWITNFEKESDWNQILVAFDGFVWEYNEDSSKFLDRLVEKDTTWGFGVTQNDSLVLKIDTDCKFTELGYRDSIPLWIYDTLYYIHQILSDSILYLYTPYTGGNATVETLEVSFKVSTDRPICSDVWMNKQFICGLEKVVAYEGDIFTNSDTTNWETFTVSAVSSMSLHRVHFTLDPTTLSRGYGYNDLRGWYVCAYNDTTEALRLNIPLYVHHNSGADLEVRVDTLSWVDDERFYADQTIRIMPPLDCIDTMYTVVVDSLVDTLGSIYEIYDTSQTWQTNEFNYNHYRIADSKRRAPFPVRILEDANSIQYLYAPYNRTVSKGDVLYILRYTQSKTDPGVPQYICHWQDRQWRAGYPDDPSVLRWSVDLDPDSFPAGHWVAINQDDGDVLTALVPLPFQDVLLAFKTKHIYGVTAGGADEYDFPIIDLVDGIGTPAWASVVTYGQAVYFYDYTGFYRYDLAGMPQKISWAIEPTIADDIDKDRAHLIVGGYFDQHLWWAYPSVSKSVRWSVVGKSGNNRILAYNLEDQAWTTIDFYTGPLGYVTPASIFVGQIESDSNGVLIGDSQRGKVYRYGLSYFDNARSITATYESGWLDVGDEYDFIKEFKDNQFLFDKHDTTKIYIDYYKDYVNTVIWTDTIGNDTNSVLTYHKRAIEGDMLAQRIKLKIRVTRIDDTFEMPFYRLKWKPVGEVLYDED